MFKKVCLKKYVKKVKGAIFKFKYEITLKFLTLISNFHPLYRLYSPFSGKNKILSHSVKMFWSYTLPN